MHLYIYIYLYLCVWKIYLWHESCLHIKDVYKTTSNFWTTGVKRSNAFTYLGGDAATKAEAELHEVMADDWLPSIFLRFPLEIWAN